MIAKTQVFHSPTQYAGFREDLRSLAGRVQSYNKSEYTLEMAAPSEHLKTKVRILSDYLYSPLKCYSYHSK